MSVDRNHMDGDCVTIGRVAPDFTALSTEGRPITLSEFRGKWVLLVSEPGNFAATTSTSILALSMHHNEFEKRNTQILVITIDNNFSNIELLKNIYDVYKIVVQFPLLEDRNADISYKYGIVNPDRIYEESVRDCFIINPNGIIRAVLTYPTSCGRNTYEILRILDSLQLTEAYNVYTPSNWMPGDPVMLPTTHSFREALLLSEEDSNRGFNCQTWYSCYKDYHSLFENSNENTASEIETTEG